MEKKKGISLIILVITIIVMIILASVIIFISSDTVNDSKKATFASDLEQVEDSVKEYYLENASLPIVEDNTIYSKTTFVDLITDGKETLESEIIENGDDEAAFYKIDMNLLNIESTKRGMEEGEDITDAYYVASNSFDVYYLKGEKIANEYYFSLSEKLTGKARLSNNNELDSSNITISSSTNGIKLTKSTADYTNNLTVKLDVTLEAGESMKYMIAGQEITVSETATVIDVASVISNDNTLKTNFYSSDTNKYLVAQKYSSGNVIAEVKLNIANLDILSGDITSANITHSKYDKFILAKISGYTDLGGSGIKETRVLYTTKKTSSGVISAYYDNLPDTITKEYVNQAGKVFNATALKLPSDIASIALVFIDNAGNVSDIKNYTFQTSSYEDLEIGDVVDYDPGLSAVYVSGLVSSSSQTINGIRFSTWRFIGLSADGDILIAPDLSTSFGKSCYVSINNSTGFINGTSGLDYICRSLYSKSGIGTARSMTIEDVWAMIGYTGDKGYYIDPDGNPVATKEPLTIGELETKFDITLNDRKTPDGRDLATYYKSDFCIITESSEMKYPENLQYVCFDTNYWLASTYSYADLSNASVYFGLCGVSSTGVGGFFVYSNADSYYMGTQDRLPRPVVTLYSSVQLVEQEDGSWKIQ